MTIAPVIKSTKVATKTTFECNSSSISFFLPLITLLTSFKTVKPSQAQIDDLLASVDVVGLGASTDAADVYAITDVRINNTGNFNTDGLDLGVYYLFAIHVYF